MIKKFSIYSLLMMLVVLSGCSKDDDEDEQSQSGTLEATIDGTAYSFKPQLVTYGSVTGRLIMPTFCEECPYAIELQVLSGLEPRTVSNAGSLDDGTLGRVLVTDLQQERGPQFKADPATITIDSHDESAQTVSGSFDFTVQTGQNKFVSGSGTFEKISYDQ